MPLDKAPYDARGHMKTHVPGRRRHETVEEYEAQTEWRDNTPFKATMELVSHIRGMSAARFVFNDQDGHQFQMFMVEMTDLFLRGNIERGVVTGMWTICKRGQNYGLKFVE